MHVKEHVQAVMALVEEIKGGLNSGQYKGACDNLKAIYESHTLFVKVTLMEVTTCLLHNDEGTVVYSEDRRKRVYFAKVVPSESLTVDQQVNGRIELLIAEGTCSRDENGIQIGTAGTEWADHVCIVRVVIGIDEI